MNLLQRSYEWISDHSRPLIIAMLSAMMIYLVYLIIYHPASPLPSDHLKHAEQSHHQQKQDYYQQIENLIQDGLTIGRSSPQQLVKHYLTLKDLYYNGIPDKYDINGFKIHGIAPDPTLAMRYLNLAIANGYQQGWIELAQMYHYGFYDFPSNLDQAERIYEYIVHHIHDRNIINQAYDLYEDAHNENQQIKTHSWLNLAYTTKIKPKKTRYELGQVKNRPATQRVTPTFLGGLVDQPTVDINTIFRTGGTPQMVDLPAEDPNQNRIQNDLHNVHSHSVMTTIKQSLEQLQKETPIMRDQSQCVAEIRQYLGSMPNNDRKADAIMALDTIEKSYLPLAFTDLKEIDALTLVWNRIHSDDHRDNLKNLKENLADELSEMIEHSKPVCATGRITRILDSLSGVDKSVNIKPTYVINEEMMNKAGKIREDAYARLNEKEKADVDSFAPNPFQKDWTQKLKEDIISQLSKDYVDSDLMLQSTFETETKKWINEI